MIVCPNG
jgi:hypothetical protein